MLFKKTLKVASATALWMVALVGASSAMAQTRRTGALYSAEALVNTGSPARPIAGIDNIAGSDNAAIVDDPAELMARVSLSTRAPPTIWGWRAPTDDEDVFIRVSSTGVLAALKRLRTLVIGTRALGAATADFDLRRRMRTASQIPATAGMAAADGAGWRYRVSVARYANAAGIRVAIEELGKSTGVDTDQVAGNDAAVTGPRCQEEWRLSVYDGSGRRTFRRGYALCRRAVMTHAAASKYSVKRDGRPPGLPAVLSTATAVSRVHGSIKNMAGLRTRGPYEVSFGGFNIMVNNGTHLASERAVRRITAQWPRRVVRP